MTTGMRTPEHVRRLSRQLREATGSRKNEQQGSDQALVTTEAETRGRKEASAEVAALFDICPSGTCVAADFASPQSADEIAALFGLPSVGLPSAAGIGEAESIASSAIEIESSQEEPTKEGAPKVQSESAAPGLPALLGSWQDDHDPTRSRWGRGGWCSLRGACWVHTRGLRLRSCSKRGAKSVPVHGTQWERKPAVLSPSFSSLEEGEEASCGPGCGLRAGGSQQEETQAFTSRRKRSRRNPRRRKQKPSHKLSP